MSWVKQKDNTFADQAGDSTSPFYIYCLVVLSSKLDHKLVINYYIKKVKEIMQGVNVFFGEDNTVKTLSLGIIAYLADRLERSSILRMVNLGSYSKRLMWTGYIDERSCLIAIHVSKRNEVIALRQIW